MRSTYGALLSPQLEQTALLTSSYIGYQTCRLFN
jgi:hypothetical protein